MSAFNGRLGVQGHPGHPRLIHGEIEASNILLLQKVTGSIGAAVLDQGHRQRCTKGRKSRVVKIACSMSATSSPMTPRCQLTIRIWPE